MLGINLFDYRTL